VSQIKAAGSQSDSNNRPWQDTTAVAAYRLTCLRLVLLPVELSCALSSVCCHGLDCAAPSLAGVDTTCSSSETNTHQHEHREPSSIVACWCLWPHNGMMLRVLGVGDRVRVCEETSPLTWTAAAAVRAASSLLATHMDTKATTEHPLEDINILCWTGGS
jgi:hypothetical protein